METLRMMRCFIRPILAACFLSISMGADAGLQEGLDAYLGGNYSVALKELTPLADKGDASAQFRLGVMNDLGKGVPQDYEKAAEWYSKSSEQNKLKAEKAKAGQQAEDEANWLIMFCGPGKDCTAVLETDSEQDKVEAQAKAA